MEINNSKVHEYQFLAEMYSSEYYPRVLVDKGKAILLTLCKRIENERPVNLTELYKLTHAATDQFNNLAEEFYENGSDIETVARDCIGMDFDFVATAYGFEDADIEELIATRDW